MFAPQTPGEQVNRVPEQTKLYRRSARESEVGALVDIPTLLAERSNHPGIIMLFMNFLSTKRIDPSVDSGLLIGGGGC